MGAVWRLHSVASSSFRPWAKPFRNGFIGGRSNGVAPRIRPHSFAHPRGAPAVMNGDSRLFRASQLRADSDRGRMPCGSTKNRNITSKPCGRSRFRIRARADGSSSGGRHTSSRTASLSESICSPVRRNTIRPPEQHRRPIRPDHSPSG